MPVLGEWGSGCELEGWGRGRTAALWVVILLSLCTCRVFWEGKIHSLWFACDTGAVFANTMSMKKKHFQIVFGRK